MAQVSLCLFDMDGVLFDSEIYFMDILIRQIATHFEIPVFSKVELYPLMAGRSSFDMIDVACSFLHVPIISVDLKSIFSSQTDTEIHHAILQREIPLKEGLLEFFLFLEENGISKAVCSNSPLSLIQKFISAYGLEQRFELLLSANTLGKLKPSPFVYLEGMAQNTAYPENTLIFEDSLVGIEAAIASKAHCIIIDQPYNRNINHLPRIKNYTQPYTFMEV